MTAVYLDDEINEDWIHIVSSLLRVEASPQSRSWSEEEAAKHPRDEKGKFAPKPEPPVNMSVDQVNDRLDPSAEKYKLHLADGYFTWGESYIDPSRPDYRLLAQDGAKLETFNEETGQWELAYKALYDAEPALRELFPNLQKVTVEETEAQTILDAMKAGTVDEIFSLDVEASWVDPDTVANLIAGLGVAKFYPDTAKVITEIRFAGDMQPEVKGNYGGMEQGRWNVILNDWEPPEPGLIQFNKERFGIEPEGWISEEYGDFKAPDFHPPGSADSWAATGRHEFGHAVYYQTPESHHQIVDYIEHRYGHPLKGRELPWVRGETKVTTPREYFPSTYAMRNQHELFAELFDFLAPGGYYSHPENGMTPSERLLEERLMKQLSDQQKFITSRAWDAEKHPRDDKGWFTTKAKDVDVPEAVPAAIRDAYVNARRELAGLTHERLIVATTNDYSGEFVERGSKPNLLVADGDADSVAPTWQMKDALGDGGVSLHNHPLGSGSGEFGWIGDAPNTFSIDDLRVAHRLGPAAMEVVTQGVVYRLEKPSSRHQWPSIDAIDAAYYRAAKVLRQHMPVGRGTSETYRRAVQELANQLPEAAIRDLVSRGRLKYTKVKP